MKNAKFKCSRAWINPATNTTYKVGEHLPRQKLAATLEKIANSPDPVKLFYRGEMAETIAKEMAEGGGFHSALSWLLGWVDYAMCRSPIK